MTWNANGLQKRRVELELYFAITFIRFSYHREEAQRRTNKEYEDDGSKVATRTKRTRDGGQQPIHQEDRDKTGRKWESSRNRIRKLLDLYRA